jgi:hypothetical protein
MVAVAFTGPDSWHNELLHFQQAVETLIINW